MDFTFRDDEMSGTIAQPKNKLFDGSADVDCNSMKLMSDDWTLDSIFPLNDDFLNDINEFNSMQFDVDSLITSANDRHSPFSSGTESEMDHDFLSTQGSTLSTTSETPMLSPQQNCISSSASDSGLSSDNIDFDANSDCDLLSSDLLQTPINPVDVIPSPATTVPIATAKTSTPFNNTVKQTAIVLPRNKAVFDEMQYLQESNGLKTETVHMLSNGVNDGTMAKRKIQIVKKMPVTINDTNATLKVTKSSTGVVTGAANTESVIANGTPIVINKVNGNISGIRKVIHVKKGPNKNSIFLPVTFKNGTDIRSIKIIKPSAVTKSPKILMAASNLLQEYKQQTETRIMSPVIKQEPQHDAKRYEDSTSDPSDNESYKFEDMFVQDDDDDDDDDDSIDIQPPMDGKSEYPKLILSNEEKRLLAKEGITLPSHYPLTKHEERELKRIRRKIRNKISAQDSRKRKKEYVDGLEERVRKCTDENQTLLKRIKMLQTQNQNLMSQMKKMQNLLTRGGSKTAQPATCLMVLLLSMALIAAPNMKFGQDQNAVAVKEMLNMEENVSQNRRMLLFDTHEKMSDVLVDEEIDTDFTPFYPKSENNDHDYAGELPLKKSDLLKTRIDELIDFDVDDDIYSPPHKKQRNGTNDQFNGIGTVKLKTEFDHLDAIVSTVGVSATSKSSQTTSPSKNGAKNQSELHEATINKRSFDLNVNDISNVIQITSGDLSAKDV